MSEEQNINALKIQELLKKLAMGEELTDKQHKEMKDYRFWKTQPVAKFDEEISEEGPIDKIKTPADIPDEPFPMLKEFEWSTIDICDKDQMEQLYDLLIDHYVEDQDESFRFAYSPEFFEWALKPPGWKPEWYVGVRVKQTGKLVAFISAIPSILDIRSKKIKSVEINFLCIHKKLRNKRLAPVLIKEITRRVNKFDIWQALYTSGAVLPSPVTVCRYTHRPINWSKLYDCGFSTKPENKTKSDMVARYALPSLTKTPGLRPMKLDDLDQVYDLFVKYQSRFAIAAEFSKDELTHWLLGTTESWKLEQDKKIIQTYVVEDPTKGKITDFFSFYILPLTVLNNPAHQSIGVAYLFYYASDADFEGDRFDPVLTAKLTKRLNSLMTDALIISKRLGIDVFNALTSQDSALFIDSLKFGMGDGFLNYYLFNYKAFPVLGGFDKKTKELDTKNRSEVGVILF